MSISIDTSELEAFGASILGGTVARRVLISAAVKKGAQNVKESIEADLQASSNRAFRRIRIQYDMQTVGNGIAADISPNDGGAGDLANIAFFGTSKGGGTHRFYEHAEDELPKLAEYVEKAGTEGALV